MYDGLYHSGVPGQKWGVRHGPPYPISRNSGGAPKRVVSTNKSQMTKSTKATMGSTVPSRTRVKRKLRISSMSDDEIRARIARLELEKRYKELAKKPVTQKKVSAGRDTANKIMLTVGQESVKLVSKILSDVVISRFTPAAKKDRSTFYSTMLDIWAKKKTDDSKMSEKKERKAIEAAAQRLYISSIAKTEMEQRLIREGRAKESDAQKLEREAAARKLVQQRINMNASLKYRDRDWYNWDDI